VGGEDAAVHHPVLLEQIRARLNLDGGGVRLRPNQPQAEQGVHRNAFEVGHRPLPLQESA
jgi:hypothetical protein